MIGEWGGRRAVTPRPPIEVPRGLYGDQPRRFRLLPRNDQAALAELMQAWTPIAAAVVRADDPKIVYAAEAARRQILACVEELVGMESDG